MKTIFTLLLLIILTKLADCQVQGEYIENQIQPTVLIEIGKYNGSGIIVGDRHDTVYLVTAKHVLFDEESRFKNLLDSEAKIHLHAKDFKSDKPTFFNLDLKYLLLNSMILVDSVHDICAVKIGIREVTGAMKYFNGISRTGHRANFIIYPLNNSLNKNDLYLGENVFIVGFPSSIGLKQYPQFDYNMPLLKRGSIAGISFKYDNIIIDSPVYHGNSGGPVFLERKDFNSYKIYLIGIVSQYIPFISQTVFKKDLTKEVSSYGVIIPIEFCKKLIYKH